MDVSLIMGLCLGAFVFCIGIDNLRVNNFRRKKKALDKKLLEDLHQCTLDAIGDED